MSTPADDTVRFATISRILLSSIGVPMFLAGLVGNLLNVAIFLRRPRFHKSSISIFLIASFLASTIILIVIFLPQLIYRLSGNDPLTNYVALCKLRWFLGPLGGIVALHCLGFAVINQYLITSRTIRYHRLITRRRAVGICCAIVLVWVGPTCPSLIFYTTFITPANTSVCNVQDVTFAVYQTYLSIVIYSILPIFILSIFSLLTWRNVRHRVRDQTVTRMLLAQIAMVLLTTIPNFANQTYFFSTRTTPKNPSRVAVESVVATVFSLFLTSTHSLSFYVYMLTSKAFREQARDLFQIRRHQIQPNVLLNNRS